MRISHRRLGLAPAKTRAKGQWTSGHPPALAVEHIRMAAPKGMRVQRIPAQDNAAVHIYSRPGTILLQIRREVPTEQDPKEVSFKVAAALTPAQALAVAGELMTVAAAAVSPKQPLSIPPSPKP